MIWWYALRAAALIAGVVNVLQLRTFRIQLLFNELVIFLCCSLLMIRHYRLNLRAAPAPRAVRPAVWIGVLAAAADFAASLALIHRFRTLYSGRRKKPKNPDTI